MAKKGSTSSRHTEQDNNNHSQGKPPRNKDLPEKKDSGIGHLSDEIKNANAAGLGTLEKEDDRFLDQ